MALASASSSNPRKPFANYDDKRAMEAVPFLERCPAQSTLEMIEATAKRRKGAPAVSFILKGSDKAAVTTLSYERLWGDIVGLANALVAAGHKPGETVALVLPNLPETVVSLYAGQAAGVVAPINPLLEPEIIGEILAEVGATTVVTLAPFLKTDLAQKTAEALKRAPRVKRVVEIDMLSYVGFPVSVIASLMRPKAPALPSGVRRLSYKQLMQGAQRDRASFQRDLGRDTVGAYYHTGGTTGTPKVAVHKHGAMVCDAFILYDIFFRDEDVILSALPLFHVFSSYVMALAPLIAGSHIVMVTPSGFRGEGVLDNFWKLVAKFRATVMCAVPTAIAALDQRKIDADVSSLRYLVSGSAPLPQALFRRFEQNTGVRILEGYGMTEGTCVTSCNPPDGERKIGSVGVPLPYMEVRISDFDDGGKHLRDLDADQVGEICFHGPCIFAGYLDPKKTAECFWTAPDGKQWLRTGDLGRLDTDGYIWITGRRKDLIIRGGHNIDPGLIEEALADHPAVAFVGAIGQPDAYAGELPCAYVELKEGAEVTITELLDYAAKHVAERAARPAAIEIMPELPKTAVGKIFKPALRKLAISRVFKDALAKAGVAAEVETVDDDTLGMVAEIAPQGPVDDALRAQIEAALSGFTRPWRLKKA